jgi:ATP-dependent helicase/nuclease subunit B
MPGMSVVWSRYGLDACETLREHVASVKRDDPMAPVTVLVPSDIAGVQGRRRLAHGLEPGRSGVAGLWVLTLDRLAELLAAPALVAAGRRPVTTPVLAGAWRRELAADPRSFGDVALHPATVQALVEAHRRLRDVPADRLDAVAATSTLTADLVALHRRVMRLLAGRWYDVADLRTAATELVGAESRYAGRVGTVLLYLPQDLDLRSAALAAALATHTSVTVIAGLTGDARADAGVTASLHRLGVTAVPPAVDPPTATEVVHASDSDDEVRTLVREVVAALRNVPAHRVAVLYGNGVPYRRLFYEHLTAAGITINGPGLRPMAERVLPRALVDLLALPDTGYDRAAVFQLLTGAPVRHPDDGAPIPAARWERISRTAGVVAGDDWDTRLRAYADEERARAAREQANLEGARQWLVERASGAARSADGLRSFMTWLRGQLEVGRAAGTWPALADWARELSGALFGGDEHRARLPEEERFAAERLDRLLDSLANLSTVEPVAGLDTMRQVVELELAEDLSRTGQFGTGVLVAPVSAAVGLDCDVVIVAGMSEGLYPGRQPADALLPDAARLATGGALPQLREHLDRRHRHLLAAFDAADRVVASFPRGDLRRSNEQLPSRWLLPTLRKLSDRTDLAATTWQRARRHTRESASYAGSLLANPYPATGQEWRVQAVAAFRAQHGTRLEPVSSAIAAALPDDPVAHRAAALLRARASGAFTRFDGNLSHVADQLPDPTASDQIVSATQLESWVACPHSHFVRRLLGVEPVEHPEELIEISPLERGLLMHEALDRFFAWLKDTDGVPGPDDPWTPAQHERLIEIGREVAGEYERRGVTGHPTMWARCRDQILADLGRFLGHAQRRRNELRTRQVRSELVFGQGRWPDPVQVGLPDGRRVRFRGGADRVDLAEDGRIIVVDYKTGNARNYQGLGADDPDQCGSHLQLPVYAYAARLRLGRPDAPVRAEYWFIGPKDTGTQIGYDVDERVDRRFADVLAVIADSVAGGLFPARAPEDQPWLTWIPCEYCDPDGLGAKRRRDEWERKKHDPRLATFLALVEPDTVANGGQGDS